MRNDSIKNIGLFDKLTNHTPNSTIRRAYHYYTYFDIKSQGCFENRFKSRRERVLPHLDLRCVGQNLSYRFFYKTALKMTYKSVKI